MSNLKIALFQMAPVWEDSASSFKKVEQLIPQALESGAHLWVLPEMFSTGFSINKALAEKTTGLTCSFLSGLAKKYEVYIAGGMLHEGLAKPHNALVVFGPDGVLELTYFKRHLFLLSEENKVFSPGSNAAVCNIYGVRFAFFICFDLRFPVDYFTVSSKCDAFLTIASWPSSRQEHFDLLLRARAIENRAYSIGVNRVGQGGGILYSGHSAVIGPDGTQIAHAGEVQQVVCANICADKVKNLRASFPMSS